ncbi:hypothetical protein F383_32975 [Gossypium arboreum]|uniref:Uncharacterized protein n=1 Tax=Gossypium arboreum TaxID=29729 RepID=A0A0B0MZV8_GOSAR|nr:hypothetical protein F383_32975 [Gossypium arboreum]
MLFTCTQTKYNEGKGCSSFSKFVVFSLLLLGV